MSFVYNPTFVLGGNFQGCRALSAAMLIVCHHSKGVFVVWLEVLDGDLHFAWPAGVQRPLSAE